MTTTGNSSSEYIIQVRDLKMHFPITRGIIFQRQVGAVKAVDGLDFDIRTGETLGLVGKSGCGKSRLVGRCFSSTGQPVVRYCFMAQTLLSCRAKKCGVCAVRYR